MSSGKNATTREPAHDIVGAARRSIRGVAARAPAHFGGRCEQRYLQAAAVVSPARLDRNAREWSAPPDHLGVVARARGVATGDEMRGLEDVRLAGAIWADERVTRRDFKPPFS